MSRIRRLNRILAHYGKALIVAMNQGGITGPIAGIIRPGGTIQQAFPGGGVGCAVGGNAWGATDHVKMTAAMAAIIHGGATVAVAL
jgi:DhnA family fructose-bisphosphate aldolase class Ia